MTVRTYLVSASGQMSLPAAVRRRWGLMEGGSVDVVDLGACVLVTPHGEGHRLLSDSLPAEDHAAYVAGLGDDPDLATT